MGTTHWILILTLFSQTPTEIESIDSIKVENFQTKKQCVEFANNHIMSIRRTRLSARFSCNELPK